MEKPVFGRQPYAVCPVAPNTTEVLIVSCDGAVFVYDMETKVYTAQPPLPGSVRAGPSPG